MPEGPELFLAAKFITTIGEKTLFGGQIVKSEVSTKNPAVAWNKEVYRIRAESRGKELRVVVAEGCEEAKGRDTLDIIFRFGMSGSFKYTPVSELHKHAHLQFYSISETPPMVLSFVDYRRFGRWEVGGSWGRDRGPDPVWEYQAFRSNVLENLKAAAFNKPICEAMLNQRYFNGIGNYLRAEILYRCGIRPFDEAREVLSEVKPFSKWFEGQTKHEVGEEKRVKPDILDLCHVVPKEVINLSGGGKGYKFDPDADDDEYAGFLAWLQCYYQDGMTNMVDHNGRTMWFSGEPGRLKPKDANSRGRVERKKKIEKKAKNKRETKEHSSDSDCKESVQRNISKQSAVKKRNTIKEPEKAAHGEQRRNIKGNIKNTNKIKTIKEEDTNTPTKNNKLVGVAITPARRSVRLRQPQ